MVVAADDHYDVLELGPEAQLIDIKKAYRRLALKHHPDRNRGSAASAAKFREISAAYTILSDAARRRDYDRTYRRRTPPRPVQQSATTTTYHPATTSTPAAPTPVTPVTPPRASPPRARSAGAPEGSPASTTPTRPRPDDATKASPPRDPLKQFDDLFQNDPFFQDAFQDMDGAFARRFDAAAADQARDDVPGAVPAATSWESVGPVPFCGLGGRGSPPRRQGAAHASPPWSEWLMGKLGIELSVTSISTRADGSVVASAYTSKTNSKKRTRTYVENGQRVSVMSMEKHGNRIEDKFVGGKMVERKVNGKVEAPEPGRVTVAS